MRRRPENGRRGPESCNRGMHNNNSTSNTTINISHGNANKKNMMNATNINDSEY